MKIKFPFPFSFNSTPVTSNLEETCSLSNLGKQDDEWVANPGTMRERTQRGRQLIGVVVQQYEHDGADLEEPHVDESVEGHDVERNGSGKLLDDHKAQVHISGDGQGNEEGIKV